MKSVNVINQTRNIAKKLRHNLRKFAVSNNYKNIRNMENKNLQFKTTLNCGGCVAKVKSDLDNAKGIVDWSVDTNNADKILTVHSDGASEEAIIAIIKSKGFNAESLAV